MIVLIYMLKIRLCYIFFFSFFYLNVGKFVKKFMMIKNFVIFKILFVIIFVKKKYDERSLV